MLYGGIQDFGSSVVHVGFTDLTAGQDEGLTFEM